MKVFLNVEFVSCLLTLSVYYADEAEEVLNALLSEFSAIITIYYMRVINFHLI